MRFWDASALTPLVVREPSTRALRSVLATDEGVVAWWGTRLECVSAIRRRERERALTSAHARQALMRLADLAGTWTEISPTDAVRMAAERALGVHPLRTGDSLQLAAAVVWRGETTDAYEFVCLDERLRDAATREGFGLLPEDGP